METWRKRAWLIAGLGAAGLLGCVVLMAVKITTFHREHPRLVFAFIPVDEREFNFAGKKVAVTDDKSDAANPAVTITYGEDTLRLPVAIPARFELPGLKSYEDWMRVVRFAPASNMTVEEFRTSLGTGVDRLAIATRTPVKGVDPQTWGNVWKTNWVFDFYEFKPEGGWVHKTLRYPTTRGARKPREGELQENTWEFQAALLLMPQAGGVGPTRNFYGDALAAAGWTLPAAAFTGLAAVLGLAFAVSPRRRALPR